MRGVVGGLLRAVLLLVGAGCAGSAQQTEAPAPRGLAAVRPAAAAVDRHALTVECGDGACPSAVGVLYHSEGTPQRCTAALVGPDRVLTAGHCLPLDRRETGQSCAGVVVAFPAAEGFPAERRRCDRIVGATANDDPRTLTPDYAIVSLDRPLGRRALELDPAPLDPGTIVTVVASSPDRRDASALAVRSRRCLVDGAEEAASVLGPGAYEVSWLGRCPIRPGNSGAPVLDGTGHVRGIVHGGSAPFFAHAVMTPAALVPRGF